MGLCQSCELKQEKHWTALPYYAWLSVNRFNTRWPSGILKSKAAWHGFNYPNSLQIFLFFFFFVPPLSFCEPYGAEQKKAPGDAESPGHHELWRFNQQLGLGACSDLQGSAVRCFRFLLIKRESCCKCKHLVGIFIKERTVTLGETVEDWSVIGLGEGCPSSEPALCEESDLFRVWNFKDLSQMLPANTLYVSTQLQLGHKHKTYLQSAGLNSLHNLFYVHTDL